MCISTPDVTQGPVVCHGQRINLFCMPPPGGEHMARYVGGWRLPAVGGMHSTAASKTL